MLFGNQQTSVVSCLLKKFGVHLNSKIVTHPLTYVKKDDTIVRMRYKSKDTGLRSSAKIFTKDGAIVEVQSVS